MKTNYLIAIVSTIIAGSVLFTLFFEYSFEKEYYEIKIQGMNDSYYVGDEYSFYYTLSGYGNTCGTWTVYYPDKDGTIRHNGAVIDCTGIANNHLSYDSRKDGREFTSFVPEIAGKYNVTVSLENGASAVYSFTVLSKNNFDSSKYTTVFDEGSPLEELGTGNAVLTEDNCNRYAYWLTKYQKEKLDKYEDYPRYPPWGNQIFPLVNYCIDVGDLIKIVSNGSVQWKFELKNKKTDMENSNVFNFTYSFGINGGNQYDSKQGIYIADMVCDPSITIDLWLEKEEKQKIWESVMKNNFFEMSDFTDTCDEFGNCRLVEPEQTITLSVTDNEKQHTVHYRGSFVGKSDTNLGSFNNIVDTINEILNSKDQIKELPKPRCLYL